MDQNQKRKKSSEVWTFFEGISKESALCKICNHTLAYSGSPSNLKKHLSRKHPSVPLSSNVSSVD